MFTGLDASTHQIDLLDANGCPNHEWFKGAVVQDVADLGQIHHADNGYQRCDLQLIDPKRK